MMLTSLTGMLLVGFLPWTICNAVYVIDGVKGAGAAVIAFIFIFNACKDNRASKVLCFL